MKTPRGVSESSTTSDNTTEFIDIVKKYDVVYNTHNPDYKNVEVKMKVWSQIAQEIGLSIDASKRKWKNLRDSYTKYLRSFRIGTKTSKKYQFWAHAENMEFLKPYQGPGRNCVSNVKSTDETEETECDLGFQVVTKAADDEAKQQQQTTEKTTINNVSCSITNTNTASTATTLSTTNIPMFTTNAFNTNNSGILLPMPSLPMVQLPPPPALPSMQNNNSMLATPLLSLPPISTANTLKPTMPLPPVSSTSTSSVGCLFIDPTQINALKDNNNICTSGVFTAPTTCTSAMSNGNQATVTKIRRSYQPFPTAATSTQFVSVPPVKVRKVQNNTEIDVTTVLQASRDLDANTLFFLSLARSVRAMPTKLQSLAKMRCMRIVSDIELELECYNSNECANEPNQDGSTQNDGGTEHFVYVMSPSRVENLIDISDDEMQSSGT